jgi:DNA polymerase-4
MGRSVTLKVKYADFQQITRSHTAPDPIPSADDLLRRSLALLDPLFPSQKGVRLLGVTVSAFEESGPSRQLGFAFVPDES